MRNYAVKHPTDHISILGVYPLTPSNNYGALYHKVTTLRVESLFNFFASPKSAILICPYSLISILEGLISLCAMFF